MKDQIPWSTVALCGLFIGAIVITNIFAPGSTTALVGAITTAIAGLGLRSLRANPDEGAK